MKGRQLLRLLVAQVCIHSVMTGTRLAAPLLALQLGYSAAAVGVLLALFALSPVVLALPAGRLADRQGLHLPVNLGVAAAVLGAAAAALWPVFPVLCIAAMLSGASAGTVQIAVQRHVGRAAADTNELKTVFSWIAIAPAMANFLGPLLAGLLIDHAGLTPAHETGFRAAFAALALLPLVGWWLVQRAPALSVTALAEDGVQRSVWDLVSAPMMRRLLFVNWLQACAWDVHTFVLPILGHERGMSASTIGVLLGAFAIAAAAVRVVLPLVARRLPEWQVMFASTLVAALALLLYPLMPGALGMGACSVVLGLTLGAVQPMVLSVLHQITPSARQGEAMALRVMTINFSSFLMPMLFGSVGAVTGMAGLFWLVGGALALGARAVPGLRLPSPHP
ncbi:MAG: MFS transporter [Burkholderiales bacterium]|nr:MFS transporter [Burkholderiales bacterium]MBK8665828.1 MFS transporter [Burkholderiales bacterium]